MSRIAFHRPARVIAPAVPEQRVTLTLPPQKPENSSSSTWLYVLLPLLSSVSMAAYLVTYGNPWLVLLGVTIVVVSVALTFGIRWQQGSAARVARERQRERYDEYLAGIRRDARASAAAQRLSDAFTHPSPERLWSIATGRRRVWERRPGDDDFLRLRMGTGTGQPAVQVAMNPRSDPMTEYDPVAERRANELVTRLARLDGRPAWLDLARAGVVSLVGRREDTRSAAFTLLSQLAVLHAPDDVAVAVHTDGAQDWEWTKWLPHTHDRRPGTDSEVVPLVAASLDGLADHLDDWLAAAARRAERPGLLTAPREPGPERRLVVVLDGYRSAAQWAREPLVARLVAESGPASGISVVCLVERENEEPGRVDVRARLGGDGRLEFTSRTSALHSAVERALADRPSPVLCEQVARALAPLQLSGDQDQVLSRTVPLPEMLGITDIAQLDPRAHWKAPDDETLLTVPIGVTGTGDELVLDLKESAQGGVGPHGLAVGATGSGKSEFLRTLVTGLTMQHSPETLSFVLVDFKGGATFAGVTDLPHVAGLITNLADDLALVDRMHAALQGEQQRRQSLLRQAGNVDSLRDYQVLQAAGGTDVDGRPLPPLPYLLIVVDEFGELLSQRPDFTELFLQIGRVGRSLGMHLLLASQRLEEGRLRGLESHLSYRIALRTFSASESRTVIGTPDAYRLPSIPGSAYLKVDESIYERFRVAHVSRPYRVADQEADLHEQQSGPPVEFGLRTEHDVAARAQQPGPLERAETERPAPGEQTEMQVAVERLRKFGTPVHQVWLPVLPGQIPLDAVLGPLEEDEFGRGLHATTWPQGELSFPIGVVDVPAEQAQRPLMLNLAAFGHVALVGAPRSGKSTALRTALLAAMLTHTPEELLIYCVDHGGGSLQALERAPHVGGVAARHDGERTRRALMTVHQLVLERERMFEEHGVSSLDELRRLAADQSLPHGTRTADVLLVIDSWGAVRAADESAEALVQEISSRGLSVGVHLLITANRWAEVRTNLRDNIQGRLELRLNEPAESEVNRKAARLLRAGTPGRGIVAPGLVFQTALPRVDGATEMGDLGTELERLAEAMAAAWEGPLPEALRVLPTTVTYGDLDRAVRDAPESTSAPGAVPIGLRDLDLGPATLDLEGGDPHLLVFGDSGSGKSSFLRAWMRGLAARRPPTEVRFVVIDYRRSLLEAVPAPYVGAQAGDADLAAAYVEQVVDKLKERLPPPDVSAQELRARSWWTGPELFVVIDDYDLVSGSASRNPLAPLVDYLAQANELGLHVVLTRRVGGAARTLMSDPLVTRLRELGSPGLVLSGDPREGVLVGDHRATTLPPGRGALVRRGRPAETVQLVVDEPDPGAAGTPPYDEAPHDVAPEAAARW